ncbi:MAG: hypothetical protein ACKVTZ_21295 [Bacteroidia bacterium]
MKRLTISTLLLAALFVGANTMQAQSVEKGNILITGYVGGPNLLSGLLKAVIKGGITDANGQPLDVTGLKATGLLPLGARAEYMVADRFGLGIDGSYATLVEAMAMEALQI